MTGKLDFHIPFAGYTSLDFLNCFSSVYMFLEGITGIDDYACASRSEGKCDGCGSCNQSTGKIQEDLFFFFGTMSGCNSLRCSFDGPNEMQKSLEDTDSVIAFIMGLAGYEYTKISGDNKNAVVRSINSGKPILARMKDPGRGSFRVICGYANDTVICPDPAGAQRKPDCDPVYDEIENMYIIGEKTKPFYGLREGFFRIINVMEYNRDMKFWDDYIKRFYYWDNLKHADFDEIKRCFKRVCDTMWHTFNCHNFAETFRHKIWDGMEEDRFAPVFNTIDAAYDDTHTKAWQVIALNECRDWTYRRYNELEWGMCGCVINCLEAIKQNDAKVLAAVREALGLI